MTGVVYRRCTVEPGQPVAIPDGTNIVQFDKALDQSQHVAIGQWLAQHPGASLRVYGNYRGDKASTGNLKS